MLKILPDSYLVEEQPILSFDPWYQDDIGEYVTRKFVDFQGRVWLQKFYKTVEVDGISSSRQQGNGGYFFSWKTDDCALPLRWTPLLEGEPDTFCDICWVYQAAAWCHPVIHDVAIHRRNEIFGETACQ